MINAPVLAHQRGLQVTEQTSGDSREYASLITATLHTTGDDITVAGASLRDEPHLVRVNNYWMDVAPSAPYMLFVDNQDQPGIIGAVGTTARPAQHQHQLHGSGPHRSPRPGDDGGGIGRPLVG